MGANICEKRAYGGTSVTRLALTGCGKTLLAVTDFCLDLIYQRSMRGNDQQQTAMFSYLTLAQRIPADHPARQIRVLVDRALARMDAELEKLYSDTGRPSIAPPPQPV
jgi:hypothetical protein